MRRYSCSKGQSLVEYALILALVGITCVGSLQGLSSQISSTITTKITPALAGAGSIGGGGDTPPVLADPAEMMSPDPVS